MTRCNPLRITSSRVFPRRLHFRMDVAHGLASRAFSDNVFVEFRSESGRSGYGECVPRPYVTGETPEGARAAIPAIAAGFEGRVFESPGDIAAVLGDDCAADPIRTDPAAFCAVELALLDLAGRHWDIPASVIMGLERSRGPLVYSLVAPLMSDGEIGRAHV